MAETSTKVYKTLREKQKLLYKQFFLFPLCFQKIVLQTCKNKDLFGKGLTKKTLEKIIRQEKNRSYQYFLLFPQCFQKLSLIGFVKLDIVGKKIKCVR